MTETFRYLVLDNAEPEHNKVAHGYGDSDKIVEVFSKFEESTHNFYNAKNPMGKITHLCADIDAHGKQGEDTLKEIQKKIEKIVSDCKEKNKAIEINFSGRGYQIFFPVKEKNCTGTDIAEQYKFAWQKLAGTLQTTYELKADSQASDIYRLFRVLYSFNTTAQKKCEPFFKQDGEKWDLEKFLEGYGTEQVQAGKPIKKGIETLNDLLINPKADFSQRNKAVMIYYNLNLDKYKKAGLSKQEICADICNYIQLNKKWENYSPQETEKYVFEFSSKNFDKPNPKQKNIHWADKKNWARKKFEIDGTIEFPDFTNFETDLTISSSIEDKTPLYLVVPFISQEKNGKNGLFFFDETKPQNAILQFENALRENFFEYSAKHNNLSLLIFSKQRINLDSPEIHISGLRTTIRDFRKIGESAHLPSMRDIVLVNSFLPAKIQTEKILHTIEQITTKQIFKDNFFSILRHPDWFEDLICSFELHAKYDYPMHIILADYEADNTAQGGCGKTDLLERINLIDGTPLPIFSLARTGTIKGLTLNFKGTRIETGYLLNVPEVAKVDEFFSVMDERQEQRTDFFKLLNDLWEHRARTSQSGNTPSTTLQPRFRAICSGNLPKNLMDMLELSREFNAPFLERNIFCFITEEHRQFVENKKTHVEKEKKKGLHKKIEIPVSDWLHSTRKIKIVYSETAEKELENVFEGCFLVRKKESTLTPLLANKRLASIFQARHRHHINCLFDGLLKLNHLLEFNEALKKALHSGNLPESIEITPTSEDFDNLRLILFNIIKTWECD